MAEAYVIDAVRTAVGKTQRLLAGIHPIDLGGTPSAASSTATTSTRRRRRRDRRLRRRRRRPGRQHRPPDLAGRRLSRRRFPVSPSTGNAVPASRRFPLGPRPSWRAPRI